MKVEHQMSPGQRDQTLIDERALNRHNTYRTELYLHVSMLHAECHRACLRTSVTELREIEGPDDGSSPKIENLQAAGTTRKRGKVAI
jgi:hypothetical protein